MTEPTNQKNQPVQISVNLDTTPVLYTDNVNLTVNPNGVVLDIMQRLGPTNQVRIVSRIGMSREYAKKFLDKNDVNKETKDKILNCVAAHHMAVPFNCIEAEICANADCYKFLHPKGFIQFITILGNRDRNLNKILDNAEEKLDEKWNVLSLDICKKELSEYYHMFKKLIKNCRKK